MELKVKKLSSVQAIKGLIGQEKIFPVYFQTNFGIHTFFMKKPIDVLVLDSNHIVKILKDNLKPGSIFMWNPRYFEVIELPAGTIFSGGIRAGQQIKLLFV